MLTITTQDSPVIGKIVQGALTLPKVCHAAPRPAAPALQYPHLGP